MADYEKRQGGAGWRSSQGRLREEAPRARREGQDHLTGYRSYEHEGEARPREAARLASSFGDVAVGANRKRELILAVSRRRSREGPAARALLRAAEREKQAARQSLADKEAQERRLRLTLQKAQEASRRRAGEVWRADPPLSLIPGQDEPGEEPEDGDDDGPSLPGDGEEDASVPSPAP